VSAEQAINKKCYNIFPSTKCHTDNCPLEQLKEGVPRVSNREVRFSSMGQKVVCNYKAERFEGKNQEFLGIIEDFKDITELTASEEDRKDSQKQFETLLNSMPVGVFIRDFEGNVSYQNSYSDKAFGLFNYEKKNIKYVFPSSQVNRYFEEDKFVDKNGLVIVEEQLIDKNRVERTYVTHKFKFIGAKNQPLIGVVSIDITKRKLAEHNAYVLTKAINNIPIGVVITSPKGIVESCNPEIEKIANQPADLILGSQFPGFKQEDNFPSLSNAIDTALLGTIFQGENLFSIYSGLTQWFEFSVSPVFNRSGEVAHLIFAFTNITERKENEKEMLIAKTKSEESDRLKTAC
jgi:PAS domain S-box-containing protein